MTPEEKSNSPSVVELARPGALLLLYRGRFSEADRQKKRAVWQVLCETFLQRYVGQDDVVVDLAAGHCDFINHIRCRQRYAVDLNPDTVEYAAPGVRVLQLPAQAMDELADASVDVVFASNFFEHLRDPDALVATLYEIRRILRPGGRLLVLQPNIRLLGGAYWDFLDHRLPLTERTLLEAFSIVGLELAELRKRFLPYTTKSRLPSWPLLVRLYVRLPPLQWLFGRQSWFVAVRP